VTGRIDHDEEVGAVTILCVRRGGVKLKPCADCGRVSGVLCDAPLERPRFGQPAPATCDRPLCTACARHIGRNLDVP
jgi:hypothetical protein